MQYDQAEKLWEQLLSALAGAGESSHTVLHNPAIKFTADCRAGKLDDIDDIEYQDLVHRIEECSAIFRDQPSAPAEDILLKAIKATKLRKSEIIELTEILSHASERTDYVKAWKKGRDTISPSLNYTPQDIYSIISSGISGQEEAKKAAALIVYNHTHGRKRNAIFAGPTGSGKSEIWRVLSKRFPFIKIFDATTISADGWKGSLHLRGILQSVPEGERQHLMIILDEADKMIEPAIGSGGVDFSAKVQSNLLKILDGDTLTFEAEDKQPAFSVDCAGISVVMLGTFEQLYTKRSQSHKLGIGFNSRTQLQADPDYATNAITVNDLISHGNMRREIAGRINSITLLHEMTADDYMTLLTGPVSPVTKLSEQYGITITVSDDLQDHLAHEAADKHLGVRYIRSSLQVMIDDLLFADPNVSAVHLTASPTTSG